MVGTLELRGHRLLAICGALAEERERPQPLEIDLDVDYDIGAAAVSDDLADAVDYGALCATVERVVVDGAFVLLERAVAAVAEAVLSDARVLSVTVTIRKLRPPVPQQLATSGVRCTRTR